MKLDPKDLSTLASIFEVEEADLHHVIKSHAAKLTPVRRKHLSNGLQSLIRGNRL